MFEKTTNFFIRVSQNYMPDPFLFAIILTLITFVLNLILIPQASLQGAINSWYDGVFGSQNIFTFAFQMTLVLVCGMTLAKAPLIKKGLTRLARIPKNQVQAAIMCFLIGAVSSFLNWGLGLVIGTIIAKEVVKRLEDVDFGYIVAAAFIGFVVCPCGISGSIVLATADPASSLNVIYKMEKYSLGLKDTVFTLYNIVPVIVVLIVVPILLKFMAPKNIKTFDRSFLFDEEVVATSELNIAEERTFSTVIENAWILSLIIVIAGFYEFIFTLHSSITINSMILLLTMFGMLLHRTPIRYVQAFVESAKSCGPMLLQYPLYGGIMALMAYSPRTGIEPLQIVLSKSLVQAATVQTLPFLNYIASCIISMIIPSAGGHWAVQGPVSIQTAMELGQSSPAYFGKLAMSVAFGEGVFNLAQPFWALPVLALARLSIRDIMGYCVIAVAVCFIIFGAALLYL